MNQKINLLIVEDNVIIADDLQQILEDFSYNVIGNVISYEQATACFEKENIDLVLIDINLSTKKTGIDLAKFINLNYHIPFIFLTSNLDDETIEEAAKTNPAAYLVKPFDNNTIYTSIEVAITNFTKTKTETKSLKEFIYLKKNNLYHKVLFEDILFIKSDNIYLEIFVSDNQKFLIRNTLKEFIKTLPANFYKSNKSYIINMNRVDNFNLNYIFINGSKISVSRDFKPYLKSLLN